MKCSRAKETRTVHLQLSEQINTYYTHACALAAETFFSQLAGMETFKLLFLSFQHKQAPDQGIIETVNQQLWS